MYQELTNLLPQIQNSDGYTAAAVIERALVSFTGRHPPKELYFTVLEKAGIKPDCKEICNADASALDGATVCVSTGTEGDVFHRIVNENAHFQYVTFSLHNIEMGNGLDIEDFFKSEIFWQKQEPWKTEIEQRIAAQKEAQKLFQAQNANHYAPRTVYRRRTRL